MEILRSIIEVLGFVLLIAGAIAVIELYLYYHFKYFNKSWFWAAGFSVFSILVFVLLKTTGFYSDRLMVYAMIWEIFFLSVSKYLIRGRNYMPYMLLAPAFIGLGVLLFYPFFFEVYLSFHDLKLTTIMQWKQTGTIPFVGLRQFVNVFTIPPLAEAGFFRLLGRTLLWTFSNIFFHVLGGFALALILSELKIFRGVYRTFLIIPWAMPQVVAVLALRGEFHSQYGFINLFIKKSLIAFPWLASLGVAPVNWLSDYPLLTCTLINIWLGIPFMMVIILGGLQSISQSYYDAASIDGASYFQKFKYITLPLIKPVLMPAVTLGTVWTFNNINVIYLVTGQAGGTEQADILVSALYKAAFTYNRYSYSAAFALVIFAILFTISLLYSRTFETKER
ncbi:MAG: sugar ABC transporter permease [Elusimicrobia bacterium CG08_land_8_20_14_0_20_51_18]|nr:MAG: sugar ABC transporter permease [Elusimicrobia bacterium CG08_land_8_20_14_0_20_51_18]